jgi:hypothetical protein
MESWVADDCKTRQEDRDDPNGTATGQDDFTISSVHIK